MLKKGLLWLLAVGLFAGCGTTQNEEVIEAVGRWVSDQSPSYYFELYEDGSCTMFNSDDEWVSAGSYQTDESRISFDMDTGSFTWSKTEDGMRFDSADGTYTYRLDTVDNS